MRERNRNHKWASRAWIKILNEIAKAQQDNIGPLLLIRPIPTKGNWEDISTWNDEANDAYFFVQFGWDKKKPLYCWKYKKWSIYSHLTRKHFAKSP
jgi:hypothetical protein